MQIRPYSKTELARAYAPKLTDGSALNRLSRWLHRNETLYTALKEAGYNAYSVFAKCASFSNILVSRDQQTLHG